MKNPIIRFIVATIAGIIALIAMVCLFTLLGLRGRLIYMINFLVAAGVWKLVYSIGQKDESEENSQEEKKD